MKQLLIRADANTDIGTGHVMRCLALAQAWQDLSGEVTFLTHESLPAGLKKRLQDEGFTIISHSNEIGSKKDAQFTIEIVRKFDSFLVLDGYKFDAKYQKMIFDAGVSSLVIDDYGHSDFYYADFVLNQNSYASSDPYHNRQPKTRLLLGSEYTLLRREFRKWCDWQREIPTTAQKLLVTLGGGDPDNMTLTVLEAIQKLSISLETLVIVGASNPHYDDLQQYIKQHRLTVKLERNVVNMPERMARADIAITAGGSTNWEMCLLGLPTAIIVIADNQRAIAQDLQDRGIAINLGWHEDVDSEQIKTILTQLRDNKSARQGMSKKARKLVDGYGAKRVVQAIKQSDIQLRYATIDDCKQVWVWANEVSVRSASFSSDFIPWESHVQWYKKKLVQDKSIFYIAENSQGTQIGQVRFELEDNEAVISVSLDASQRGFGYGTALIQVGANTLFNQTDTQLIHAYIKTENLVSRRAFEKADFVLKEITTYADHEAFHLIRTRGNL